jgi:hypothetical protein
MVVISSNTLFHFTNSAENIIQIIKNGFYPKFCLEESNYNNLIFNDKTIEEEAIPMTCFCDLPLSKIESHLKFYGSYGIGLSKEWAMEKGLTPLTYIHEKSIQINYIRKLSSFIIDSLKKNDFKFENLFEHPFISLMELSAFYKPYFGKMWRNGNYVDKRFYDEAEWRYVPLLKSSSKIEYRLNKGEYLNDIMRANSNDLIAHEFALTFLSTDIKYIIVRKEEEKISLSDAIENMTKLFKNEEIKNLRTKIISSEQIILDF